MRVLVASLPLWCGCAGPTLDLDLRAAGQGRAELTALARDGADAPGRGVVAVVVHEPSPLTASLELDEAGLGRVVFEASGATVRATATWQGVQSSVEERLTPVTSSGFSAGDGAPPTSSLATGSPAAHPPTTTTTSPTPVGIRYFGGGDVQLTLEVVDQDGTPTASHVTLEAQGRWQTLLARADGLVTFLDVPAGPAVVTAGTTKAEPCIAGQVCISGWRSQRTSIVVGPARTTRLRVDSGW
ncbi:MAG: hypothetical protein JNJ54_32210 [Myxococcaceae bacterium]|nr:hypothetical protein [Myxococcaceae bacterium]